MNKDNTSGFCSQGHLLPEQVEIVEVDEAIRRIESCRALGERLTRRLDEEVDADLGPRGERKEGVSGKLVCRKCGTQLRAKFRRNGGYRRQIVTMEGVVTVRVPLIKCVCGGYATFPWKTLPPRARYWYDVVLHWERVYPTGPSYRKAAGLLSEATAIQVSHMSGWREMQKAGSAARAVKGAMTCPKVVLLDEMWVWEKGAQRAILLAMDVDGTILDSEGPTSRSAENWRKLLERLSGRGVAPDHGLRYVVADGDASIRQAVEWVWGGAELQHCVWHILAAVEAEAKKAFGAASHLVKDVVAEARAILLHDERTAEAGVRAGERLAAFTRKHAGRPWADIVARGFTQALTYLRSPWVPRTNSTAERAIKELRRRIKTMDGFKSHLGAKNCLAVLIQWYNWWRENHSPTMQRRCQVQP